MGDLKLCARGIASPWHVQPESGELGHATWLLLCRGNTEEPSQHRTGKWDSGSTLSIFIQHFEQLALFFSFCCACECIKCSLQAARCPTESPRGREANIKKGNKRWRNSPKVPNHEENQPSCCPTHKHSSPPPLGALPDFHFVGWITQVLSCPVGHPCKYRPVPGLCRGSVAGHLHHLRLADNASRERATIQFWPIPGLPPLLMNHKWSGFLCSIPILSFFRATIAEFIAREHRH